MDRQIGWMDQLIDKDSQGGKRSIKMIDNSNSVNEMEFWVISVFFFAFLNFPVILSLIVHYLYTF